MNYPPLYKRTSTGAIQVWVIRVDGSTIVTTYGQDGGKMQQARDTITEGKNVGRANETTPEGQAALEAQAQWTAKLKKGYVTTLAAAKDGLVDDVIEGGISPMLAHVFSKQGHKITYPAFVQPKLDGHRCIAILKDGKCTLWSRTRKPITSVPHIVDAIERTFKGDTVLDGELYNHDYRDRFEELTSFIRQETPKPGHEAVQYHVYDAPSAFPFERRRLDIAHMTWPTSPLVTVRTVRVGSEDEAIEAFNEFRAQGYEGAMIRNADSLYVNKRSYDLQKIKEFDDAEFTIVGIDNDGRGKMAGKGIFVCSTETGEQFRCKMAGNLDDLVQYVEQPDQFIGRSLTVQFQGFTNAGVPRFPVGLRIREDV